MTTGKSLRLKPGLGRGRKLSQELKLQLLGPHNKVEAVVEKEVRRLSIAVCSNLPPLMNLAVIRSNRWFLVRLPERRPSVKWEVLPLNKHHKSSQLLALIVLEIPLTETLPMPQFVHQPQE